MIAFGLSCTPLWASGALVPSVDSHPVASPTASSEIDLSKNSSVFPHNTQLTDLSMDALGHVATHLDSKSLKNLALVNHFCHDLVNDPSCMIARGACLNFKDLESFEAGSAHYKTFIQQGGKVKVRGGTWLTDDLLAHLKGAGHVILSGCENITDKGLSHLNSAHTLDLYGHRNITGEGFKHLGKVRRINISFCTDVTDENLQYLSHVHILGMKFCAKVTDKGLKHLSDVRKLEIMACESVNGESFEYLQHMHTLNAAQTSQVKVYNT